MKVMLFYKRICIVIIFGFLFSFSAKCQWSFGLRSGINFNKQKHYWNTEKTKTSDAIKGFEFGAIVEKETNLGIVFEGGLSLIQKGQRLSGLYVLKINTLEANVILNYRLHFNNISFSLGGGGFLDYAINAKDKISGIDESFNGYSVKRDFINREGGGILLNTSIGYRLNSGKIYIDCRHRSSINNFINEAQEEEGEFSTKNVGIAFNFGYSWFF